MANDLSKQIRDLIDGLKHAREFDSDEYVQLSIIQRGVSFHKKIPKWFWQNDNVKHYGVLGTYDRIPRGKFIDLKNRIIQEIFAALNEELEVDGYFRLLHAFTVLDVVGLVGEAEDNLKFNIARNLWRLDDGTKRSFEILYATALYTSWL